MLIISFNLSRGSLSGANSTTLSIVNSSMFSRPLLSFLKHGPTSKILTGFVNFLRDLIMWYRLGASIGLKHFPSPSQKICFQSLCVSLISMRSTNSLEMISGVLTSTNPAEVSASINLDSSCLIRGFLVILSRLSRASLCLRSHVLARLSKALSRSFSFLNVRLT